MLYIPPTNLLLPTAKQEPYKKNKLSRNEKYRRIFWYRFRRKDQQAEKNKTERVTGLGVHLPIAKRERRINDTVVCLSIVHKEQQTQFCLLKFTFTADVTIS